MTDGMKKDTRVFGWGGKEIKSDKGPIVTPDDCDKDGDKLTDLSYGWTIRGLTVNSMSQVTLAGDRARRSGEGAKQPLKGNHREGWNVVHLDGHTSALKAGDPEEGKRIASTDKSGGGYFLIAYDDDAAGAQAAKPQAKAEYKLSINPYSKAKADDWAVYSFKVSSPDRTESAVMEMRVSKVEGSKVTIHEKSSDGRDRTRDAVDAKADLTIPAVLGLEEDAELKDVKISDAKEKVGDAEVPCKKVTCLMAGGREATPACVLLVSESVKVTGLVSMEISMKDPKEGEVKVSFTLVGYGNGDKTEWGKSYSDAEAAQKKEKK
jgi:hypothetical protein